MFEVLIVNMDNIDMVAEVSGRSAEALVEEFHEKWEHGHVAMLPVLRSEVKEWVEANKVMLMMKYGLPRDRFEAWIRELGQEHLSRHIRMYKAMLKNDEVEVGRIASENLKAATRPGLYADFILRDQS